jgi:hypothetical protein
MGHNVTETGSFRYQTARELRVNRHESLPLDR